ncbi:SGNH/GDSL hydrolase family protein [Stenotrophomonas sp. C3(2023)]|uniref:SGNH/GDSL hydrolase family protein n=1 Tax=Stenotrophomonas sp. C3(2023) TaxID=3080277 RepID=UPI00293D0316|nr:SGNH/GDSL hydrolase family protein [Stenotrophomonas sp. C3(2023)]MDV3470014.1 SGNH/GDSL hydrolase family protein [Stenotrophomonas sp. C3(2023)]
MRAPALLALALSAVLAASPTVSAHALQDFGDAPAARALARLQPGAEAGARLHLVQIGDSHTAGDYFTDRLRERLQQRIGDGGMGWAMPAWFNGQRMSRVGYDQQGLVLLSSRSSGEADYPFGGLIAQGGGTPTALTIKSKAGDQPLQEVTVLLSQGATDPDLDVVDADGRQLRFSSPVVEPGWASFSFKARLPFTLTTQGSPETRIGGWWLGSGRPGAIVSAVGINGAELAHWSRWRPGWMQDLAAGKPDIVAIAYGTNEAFRSPLSAEQFRGELEAAIDQLRRQLPGVGVLVIGAPESLKSQAGSCGQRAPSLDMVQQIQREVAQQRRTLYWDWQQAMGGRCSMKGWVGSGLARKDGVHFSKEGYERAADDLYQGLVAPR